jgi:hypothetical protein
LDQHPETQAHDLRQLAQQRGFTIVEEFVDHTRTFVLVTRPSTHCVDFQVDKTGLNNGSIKKHGSSLQMAPSLQQRLEDVRDRLASLSSTVY